MAAIFWGLVIYLVGKLRTLTLPLKNKEDWFIRIDANAVFPAFLKTPSEFVQMHELITVQVEIN